jgi:chemosensory pili system protein ChpA (sensor histidine kinase/response regulator)
LAAGKKSAFPTEIMMIATQLASLGEILQISAFVKLCDSIIRDLKTTDSEEATVEIAKLALLAWRRSQELILKNKWDLLPTKIVWHQTNDNQEIEVQLISLCSGNV